MIIDFRRYAMPRAMMMLFAAAAIYADAALMLRYDTLRDAYAQLLLLYAASRRALRYAERFSPRCFSVDDADIIAVIFCRQGAAPRGAALLLC